IARRPDWWFVLLLLPVVNLVTGILLCGRIATIMRRSPIWGPVMVIPGLNLIPWTYLAISPAPQDLPRSDTQGLIDRWDVLLADLPYSSGESVAPCSSSPRSSAGTRSRRATGVGGAHGRVWRRWGPPHLSSRGRYSLTRPMAPVRAGRS